MFGIDDAIVAAGVTALGSMAGAGITAASQQAPSSTTHQAKLNLKYGKLYDTWAAENLPTLNRSGMENAGFNPILAYSQGHSGTGFSGVSGSPAYSSIGNADFGSTVSSAVNAYLDFKTRQNNLMLQNEQLKVLSSQADRNTAQAELSRSRALHPQGMIEAFSKGSKSLIDWLTDPSKSDERKNAFKAIRDVFKPFNSSSASHQVRDNATHIQKNYYLSNPNKSSPGYNPYNGDFFLPE